MIKVNVTDRAGRAHAIEASTELPLMFSLREAGLPVEGTCGGVASCGTCQVYVDAFWFRLIETADELEQEMLSALQSNDPSRSRLSCQIQLTDLLDGMCVALAPEE